MQNMTNMCLLCLCCRWKRTLWRTSLIFLVFTGTRGWARSTSVWCNSSNEATPCSTCLPALDPSLSQLPALAQTCQPMISTRSPTNGCSTTASSTRWRRKSELLTWTAERSSRDPWSRSCLHCWQQKSLFILWWTCPPWLWSSWMHLGACCTRSLAVMRTYPQCTATASLKMTTLRQMWWRGPPKASDSLWRTDALCILCAMWHPTKIWCVSGSQSLKKSSSAAITNRQVRFHRTLRT